MAVTITEPVIQADPLRALADMLNASIAWFNLRAKTLGDSDSYLSEESVAPCVDVWVENGNLRGNVQDGCLRARWILPLEAAS